MWSLIALTTVLLSVSDVASAESIRGSVDEKVRALLFLLYADMFALIKMIDTYCVDRLAWRQGEQGNRLGADDTRTQDIESCASPESQEQ